MQFLVDSRWASQCLGESSVYHDSNRRTSEFRYVGQNYASKSHSANLGEKFLSAMIQDLFDEVNIIIIRVRTSIFYSSDIFRNCDFRSH